jgi:SAM-dependent methyltransferase
MSFFNYDPNAWENTAPEYANYLLGKTERPHYAYIYEKMALEYKPGMKVLEVGCAGGHDYEHLCGHAPIDDFTGVDITKSYIEVAKKNHPEAKWVNADARELPFEDKRFDITFCLLMLLHLDRAGVINAVQEMARVTKSLIFIHTYAAEKRYDSIRLEPGKNFPKPTPGSTCTLMPRNDGTIGYSTALESTFNSRYFLYNICALPELTAPGWTTDWLYHDDMVGVAGHENTFFDYIPDEVDVTYEFMMRRNKA